MTLWPLGDVKNSDLVTLLLALWGAILSTATTFLAVILFFKDRSIVKVRASHSLYFPTAPHSSGKSLPCLSVEISNSGRRSITVQSFYLQFNDQSALHVYDSSLFLMGGKDLPIKLDEGASYSVMILLGTIASDIRTKGEYPKYACYKDALGRVYRHKTSKRFWDGLFALTK